MNEGIGEAGQGGSKSAGEEAAACGQAAGARAAAPCAAPAPRPIQARAHRGRSAPAGGSEGCGVGRRRRRRLAAKRSSQPPARAAAALDIQKRARPVPPCPAFPALPAPPRTVLRMGRFSGAVACCRVRPSWASAACGRVEGGRLGGAAGFGRGGGGAGDAGGQAAGCGRGTCWSGCRGACQPAGAARPPRPRAANRPTLVGQPRRGQRWVRAAPASP